jgi:hemolysin activation/secretion protein
MKASRLILRIGGIAFALCLSAAAAAADSNPVPVDRVAFRGNKAVHTAALQTVAAAYLHRGLTADDIEALRAALTHRYTDQGYVNSRVVLDPDGAYRDGLLRFWVIEGRISEIHVHGLDGLLQSYVVDRLRGAPGEALNLNVLQARLQRLSDDPLFAHVNSQLQPGEDPAEVILDVDVKRARPYSASLALNNYRPPAIGEKGYDLVGQVRDLTGIGDVVDANVTGPVEFSGGVGYALSWQVPIDRYDTSLSLATSKNIAVVSQEPASPLDARSTTDRQELKLTQPLWISGRQQLNLAASIALEKETVSLPGSSEEDTRSVTARLIPDYSLRTEQQYLDVKFTLLHAYLLDYPTGRVSYSLPDQQYFVWTGQIYNLWEFAQAPFELESRAILQRTDAPISDLHEMAIGGVYSVRGFREDEFLASNAENATVDFRWLALRTANAGWPAVTVGTFFDWAAGHDVGEPNETFSSCGLTFRLKWPHVQADLAYGLPLVHPGFVSAEHGSWQDHGIHAQILMSL